MAMSALTIPRRSCSHPARQPLHIHTSSLWLTHPCPRSPLHTVDAEAPRCCQHNNNSAVAGSNRFKRFNQTMNQDLRYFGLQSNVKLLLVEWDTSILIPL